MCHIPLVCLDWKISVVQTSRPAASTGKHLEGHLPKPHNAALLTPSPHYLHMPWSFQTLKLHLFFWNCSNALSCFSDPSRSFWFSSQFPTYPYHFQSRAYTSGDLAVWFSSICWISCPNFLSLQSYIFFSLINYYCAPNAIRVQE